MSEQIIYEMLTENTGSHFLDSGGAYGRNWEHNQKRTIEDFRSDDEQTYELDCYGGKLSLSRTVSVFHYLSQLETDDICEEFNKSNVGADNWDSETYYGVSKQGQAILDREGFAEENTWNTYNGDCDLSQTLQGSWLISENDSGYLLLQIHQGCDVRGGYTDARMFGPLDMCEGIHEYLNEYSDSYTLNDELEYITEVICQGRRIKFTDFLRQIMWDDEEIDLDFYLEHGEEAYDGMQEEDRRRFIKDPTQIKLFEATQ